jgi:putative membrane protein
MRYYLIVSLLTGPGFPIVLLASWFRYSTLRYRLDQEGIWMGCGVLFKNEVNLAYRRIQDIHLTRNFIQRWMGLATVSVQTASGSATAEMTIEGILSAEELRDYLYVKMRGARGLDHGLDHGPDHPPDRTHPNADAAGSSSPADEALVLLREIRDALQARPHTDPHRPTSQEDRA